jgi:hypothetical protein
VALWDEKLYMPKDTLLKLFSVPFKKKFIVCQSHLNFSSLSCVAGATTWNLQWRPAGRPWRPLQEKALLRRKDMELQAQSWWNLTPLLSSWPSLRSRHLGGDCLSQCAALRPHCGTISKKRLRSPSTRQRREPPLNPKYYRQRSRCVAR